MFEPGPGYIVIDLLQALQEQEAEQRAAAELAALAEAGAAAAREAARAQRAAGDRARHAREAHLVDVCRCGGTARRDDGWTSPRPGWWVHAGCGLPSAPWLASRPPAPRRTYLLGRGDRIVVRGRWRGVVVNVATDGDPYVRLDQGSAGVYPADHVTPHAPEPPRADEPGTHRED